MKGALIGAALLLLSTSVNAQKSVPPPTTPEEYAQIRVEAYAAALGLSEDQKESFKEVFTQGEEEAAELRAACREAQEAVTCIMAKRDAEVAKQLTKEQTAQLANLQKQGSFNAEVMSCAPAACSKSCCTSTKQKSAKAGGEGPTVTPLPVATPELSAPE